MPVSVPCAPREECSPEPVGVKAEPSVVPSLDPAGFGAPEWVRGAREEHWVFVD